MAEQHPSVVVVIAVDDAVVIVAAVVGDAAGIDGRTWTCQTDGHHKGIPNRDKGKKKKLWPADWLPEVVVVVCC